MLTADKTLWETYKDVTTPGGVPFMKCIRPGLENKHGDGVGLCAGDVNSYTTFAGVFDAVVAKRHAGYARDAVHTTDLELSKIVGTALSDKYVMSVRLRTGRNITGINLPGATDRAGKAAVEAAVVPALLAMADGGEYFPLMGSTTYAAAPEGMTLEQEDVLRDGGLLFDEPESAYIRSCGIDGDWPEGRGVFASADKGFMVWVNEHDHARCASTVVCLGLQPATPRPPSCLACELVPQLDNCPPGETIAGCSRWRAARMSRAASRHCSKA
eukprot:SAG22_NODE_904_length_6586_cov_3.133498_5_plen_271_part_00